MAQNVSPERIELLQYVRRLRDLHSRLIAKHCLGTQLGNTRRQMQLQVAYEVADPTEEDVASVNESDAIERIAALAFAAGKDRGVAVAHTAAELGRAFFEANGSTYRALEQDAIPSFGKDPFYSNGGKIPKSLRLWSLPFIQPDSEPLGPHSLLGMDRQNLLQGAEQYYHLGTRCMWFERMLVESIVAAEVFATYRTARETPALLHGHLGFVKTALWTWIYSSTQGRSPKFELFLALSTISLGILKLGFVLGLAFYSSERVDAGHEITGYLGLAVAGWVAVNMVGRFVARKIVGWASPTGVLSRDPSKDTFGGRVILAMTVAYGSLRGGVISIRYVRELLADAAKKGAAFDPIIFALLDRAIAAGETSWTDSWRKVRFEDGYRESLGSDLPEDFVDHY